MKTKIKIIRVLAGVFLVGILSACTSDIPQTARGTGIVRMNVSMSSKITRGDITEVELEALQESCVVYISDEIGLLHKWKGLSNVPSELSMKYDSYVAEAWAGDSISASFDKKFYKGMTTFTVSEENKSQNVVINCKISNVIGSVDVPTINFELIKDVEVTFSNSVASLSMSGEELFNKCYFMMPDNDTELKYSVSGKNTNGEPFCKEDVVTNVQAGHEYRLKIITDPAQSTTGGAFFDIVVEEFNELIDDEFIIYGKPSFSWNNSTLSLDGQLVNTTNSFNDEILRIAAYNDGFQSLMIETDNMNEYIGAESYNLVQVTEENLQVLANKGLILEKGAPNKDGMYIWYLNFTKELLNSLPPSDNEYSLRVTATDYKNKSNSIVVRIANTKEAISDPDPIVVDVESFEKDHMAIGATSVTIPVNIIDPSREYAIQYRVEYTDSWINQEIVLSRDGTVYNVILNNLYPDTYYEYKVITLTFKEGEKPFESKINKFKTEEKFIIPNASMEDWYKDGKILEPCLQNSLHTFWDTGNHGASMAGVTLTQNSTEIVGKGTYSARLRSQKAQVLGIGKHAAGNLFAGTYVKTSGTNGIIDFGQPYNGSHPKALKLMANYRPGIVQENVSGQEFLNKGDTDKGQIYIALTTEPVTVNTGDKNTLFNENLKSVLAYGEITWDGNFGADNQLQEVIIDFNYKENAKTTVPKYLVIVCSASKYGDYFVGGEGSTMFVDDFELVY